ncbi:MAG: rhomboid family intramembrane serine protease [Pseudomonas sp.]
MFRAMECPLDEDLSAFTRFLRERGVVHRISVEGSQQVVWTYDEAGAQIVRAFYAEEIPDLIVDPENEAAAGKPASASWPLVWRKIPVTLAVLAVTGLVALLTGLGTRIDSIGLFTFVPVDAEGYFYPQMDLSQWWRLVAPIFLHFGLMHLAFNALWYWELGRRVEMRSGGLWLLGLTLLFAIISNTAQWLVGGNPLFGGLSGVLYGLLGYCWLYQWLAPNVHFALPKGVVVLMLVWLVLCLSGLVTLLGFGAIANTAHVSGLLVGCAAGLIAGGLQRARQSPSSP